MAIPNKQIGWSDDLKLLYQISKQLERLICMINAANCANSTTTTTTENPV
jgi:hypothetical protein